MGQRRGLCRRRLGRRTLTARRDRIQAVEAEEQEPTGLLPASPLRRLVFVTCMAVVAISIVMQLVWAVQRHF